MTPVEKDKTSTGFLYSLGIAKWIVGFCFKLAPVETGAFFACEALSNLDQIINPFIFAKILDSVIKIVGKTESLASVFPWLAVFFFYNLLISLIRYLRSFYRNNLRVINDWKIDQKLYEKVNTLGIQIQENPEFANYLQRAKETTMNVSNFMERICEFLSILLTLIVSALIVFKAAPLIILLIIIFSIPSYLTDRKYMRGVWNYHRNTTEERRSVRASSNTLLDSAKLHEINISSAFNYLNNYFRKYADKTLKFYRESK